ncbi:N-acetyl-gamma-glutamyl-phosphate reductase [Salinispira pacifica]|uniref:N-acetyl-gamma-glutamyl-phosphate reductase n=1 Tax=Salinispira pacifica TaxID=1307761 RepID=V5WL39_9SPIO|nr:N-acetyl-gamma-glutamyl-phosphate reductase [Salinispira pacifica]AHC16370.1 N-acetyl-gamma-glutamyl-phosphate reductase [Salinispira pacifica]
MKAAVIGSTGYTGQVLLRLLSHHPNIDTIYPVSRSKAGTSLFEEDPGLDPSAAGKFSARRGTYISMEDFRSISPPADVVFAALPHLKSAETLEGLFRNTVIIDLSADFRIPDHRIFQSAYGVQPPRPDLLESAVYGLSEINREQIAGADLIANPGCYPTATMLPLLPLAREGLVGSDVIINAMSGISGAGKKERENLLYTSRTENAAAYAPGRSHRHWQEIDFHLNRLSGNTRLNCYFTPHMIPMHHGMAVTTSFTLAPGWEAGRISEIYHGRYERSPFVRLSTKIPETKDVRGTNRCHIHWHVEGDRIFLMSVIDNLYKGASGQAVQNMNIRFGLDEHAGLNLNGEV